MILLYFNGFCRYDDQLQGSALRYLSSDNLSNFLLSFNNIDKKLDWSVVKEESNNFFAIDFFEPGGCLASLYPQWCVEYNASSLKSNNTYIFVGERIYMLNITHIGPYANTTIPSQVLLFSL